MSVRIKKTAIATCDIQVPDMPEGFQERFLQSTRCERCGTILYSRTASFFNADVICLRCNDEDMKIKDELQRRGVDTRRLENCGYVPTI